jgi:hypothetical protein
MTCVLGLDKDSTILWYMPPTYGYPQFAGNQNL